MDIFQTFGHLIAGIGIFLSSLFGHNPAVNTQQVMPSVTVQNSGDVYTASKTVEFEGHSVTMNISVPKNGGNISGNLAGDCTGDLTGNYDGKESGAISGTADATCKVAFISVPAHITFDGTVNKADKTAHVMTHVKVDSLERSQTVDFSFK